MTHKRTITHATSPLFCNRTTVVRLQNKGFWRSSATSALALSISWPWPWSQVLEHKVLENITGLFQISNPKWSLRRMTTYNNQYEKEEW